MYIANKESYRSGIWLKWNELLYSWSIVCLRLLDHEGSKLAQTRFRCLNSLNITFELFFVNLDNSIIIILWNERIKIILNYLFLFPRNFCKPPWDSVNLLFKIGTLINDLGFKWKAYNSSLRFIKGFIVKVKILCMIYSLNLSLIRKKDWFWIKLMTMAWFLLEIICLRKIIEKLIMKTFD